MDLTRFDNMDVTIRMLDNVILALQSLTEDRKISISGLMDSIKDEMASTLSRELAFNLDHSTQLLAIIRLILNGDKSSVISV